jgi:hypothetical protein
MTVVKKNQLINAPKTHHRDRVQSWQIQLHQRSAGGFIKASGAAQCGRLAA